MHAGECILSEHAHRCTHVHMFVYIPGSDLDNEFIQCLNSTLLCGDRVDNLLCVISDDVTEAKER